MIIGKTMKALLSQKGMSILEAVVALGLLGLGSYFLTGVFKNGVVGQKTLLAQDDARVLTDNISSILSDRIACENTFGGIAASPNPPPAANPVDGDGTDVLNIVNAMMKAEFTVGKSYGNRGIKLVGIRIGGTGVDTKTQIQKWVPGFPPITGVALVLLSWKQTGNTGSHSGPQIMTRFILVNVTNIDALHRIVTCTSQGGGGAGGGSSFWTLASNGLDIYNSNNGGLGKVGIQTTTPKAALDVEGTGGVLLNAGNVGIGSAQPKATLDVNGGILLGTEITGGACTVEGTLRYDSTNHWPIYCGSTSVWTKLGGGGPSLQCKVVLGPIVAGGTSNVTCPTGTMTGGGCATISGSAPTAYASSYPTNTNTWTCNQGTNAIVRAMAICCN
jgi:hypothetical protein